MKLEVNGKALGAAALVALGYVVHMTKARKDCTTDVKSTHPVQHDDPTCFQRAGGNTNRFAGEYAGSMKNNNGPASKFDEQGDPQAYAKFIGYVRGRTDLSNAGFGNFGSFAGKSDKVLVSTSDLQAYTEAFIRRLWEESNFGLNPEDDPTAEADGNKLERILGGLGFDLHHAYPYFGELSIITLDDFILYAIACNNGHIGGVGWYEFLLRTGVISVDNDRVVNLHVETDPTPGHLRLVVDSDVTNGVTESKTGGRVENTD
jgi:hypothetical protein